MAPGTGYQSFADSTIRSKWNGWLNRFDTGVYYRPDLKNAREPSWPDTLQAVSEQLHLDVHLSGLVQLQTEFYLQRS